MMRGPASAYDNRPENDGLYVLMHDETEIITGTYHECWMYLHHYQNFSTDYALKYGRYKIVPGVRAESDQAETGRKVVIMAREATRRLLTLIEDGVLDADTVVDACLTYMSEDEVAEMCCMNEFFMDEETDDTDDETEEG